MDRKQNAIHLDHINFDKVLNVLQATVSELVDGNSNDRQKQDLLYSIIYYIRMYPDRVHHPKEEKHLFPILLQKDPELKNLIDQLQGQHNMGEKHVGELNEALNAFMKAPENKTDQLQGAAAKFIAFQRNHIGLEERELLPKAYEVLSDDDWVRIEKAFQSNADPLFGENIETGYQSLFQRIIS